MPGTTPRHRGVVLLVEEIEALRDLVAREFEASGLPLTLIQSASAARALALIRGPERPDLVLMSRSLPDAAPLDLLRQVKERCADLPVFILSESESEQEAVEAMTRGAADHLVLRAHTLAKLPWLAMRTLERQPPPSAPAGADSPVASISGAVSHDLRTPLTGLRAHVDMMADGADGPLAEAQKGRLERMREALAKLVVIANQLSDLSRVESGRLPLQASQVDLEEMVRRSCEDLAPSARMRAVEIQVRPAADTPPILGDPQRVRQILDLVVAASLKRSAATTLIVALEPHGTMVRVTLRDQPRGIPVEALPPEFHDESIAAAASSIGLSVARGLIQLHGGTLLVNGSNGAEGLLASFTLPAASPEARRPADKPRDIRPRT